MNLSGRYCTTALEAAVHESMLNKYCSVVEFEAGRLKGVMTACGSIVDADATSCPDCGRLFGRCKTRFRREPDLRVFGEAVGYLTCMACYITFPYVCTVPFYCPWCGRENVERDGYVRSQEDPWFEAEEGQE